MIILYLFNICCNVTLLFVDVSGGVASMGAACVTHPLDLLKGKLILYSCNQGPKVTQM
jgi:hypothetical protein